jgi:epoxyqueuosine reductase
MVMDAAAGTTARRLTEWARELGFDRAGVTPLGPAAGAAAFERWLGRGDHAGMEYMSRRGAERLDPRRIFDGARSALCVALQYHPPAAAEPGGDLWPGVARYARGRDYHNVMGKRLRRLARRIVAAYPQVRTRVYVDTGPVLERELAARAGLGVAGKNTMLLHPEAGS